MTHCVSRERPCEHPRRLHLPAIPRPTRATTPLCSFYLVILILFCGCYTSESVVVYESVPKTRVVDESHLVQMPGDVPSGEPKFRMIVAIADTDSGTWFFKLSGPIADIEEQSTDWNAFLNSVEFDENDQPTWTLPDEWQTGEGSEMRFATLRTGSESTAPEISVSQLPPRQDILGNVNRWRGQLGLGPLSPNQLQENLSTIENSQVNFKIFDAQGPQLDTGMAGPFAGGGRMGQMHPPLASPITFDAPPGWESGPTSSMVAGRWTKTVDEQQAELSVLNMNPSEESWRMNVQAWSAQLKLEEAVDVDGLTESVRLAGKPARRLRLDAVQGEEAGKSIIVVMIVGDTGWLIKFAGDTELVDQLKPEFESFIESISVR